MHMGSGPHLSGSRGRQRPAGWAPPSDWTARGAIIEPPGYDPSPWELRPPDVLTAKDALRERQRCADPETGLIYMAFHWAWTVHVDDPSGTPRVRRLPAYPYLRELLIAIREPTNIVTEKSRQMLASWAYVMAFLHDLLFRRDWPMVMASRRSKEVDDGGEKSTVDSLFGKVRFVHSHLPPFLWEPLEIKQYKITNTRRNTHITGETGAGGQAGRGPAYKRGLFDEAAHASHGEGMFSGLRQSCKTGLALNSSPQGRGNVFARIALSRTTTFKKIRIPWYRNPEKAVGLGCTCGWQAVSGAGEPAAQFDAHRPACPKAIATGGGAKPTNGWYRTECRDMTPEQVASELDISYDRSSGTTVFDGYDSLRHYFEVPDTVGRISGRRIGLPRVNEEPDDYRRRALAELIDPGKPLVIGWDYGVGDETAILLGQALNESTMATVWLDEIVDRGKAWHHYHGRIVALWYTAYLMACGWTPARLQTWADARKYDWSARVFLVPDLQEELPQGCLPVYHAGDPSGKSRESDLRSWVMNLGEADPPMVIQSVPFGPAAGQADTHRGTPGSMLDWIDLTREVVRRDGVKVSSFCTRVADMLGGWRWPTNRDGQLLPGRQLPVHDKHSHPGTALIYLYRTRWQGQLIDRARGRQHAGHVVALDSGRELREPADLVVRDRRWKAEPSLVGSRDDDGDDE